MYAGTELVAGTFVGSVTRYPQYLADAGSNVLALAMSAVGDETVATEGGSCLDGSQPAQWLDLQFRPWATGMSGLVGGSLQLLARTGTTWVGPGELTLRIDWLLEGGDRLGDAVASATESVQLAPGDERLVHFTLAPVQVDAEAGILVRVFVRVYCPAGFNVELVWGTDLGHHAAGVQLTWDSVLDLAAEGLDSSGLLTLESGNAHFLSAVLTRCTDSDGLAPAASHC